MGHIMGDWTFFSNYGHVLVCLSRNREARLRDVAAEVGITERAVQKIVRDLQDAGFLTVTKQGRCNRYRINRRKSLRHDLESHCTVGKLLNLVSRAGQQEQRPEPEAGMGTAAATATVSMSRKQSVIEPEPSQQAADKDKESGTQPAAADTRQQGSLF
jgi:predicted ArsR family transcriptional regulator